MLQQVFVLQQQLVDSSLGFQPSRGLGTQLVLQEVDLHQKDREREGNTSAHLNVELTNRFLITVQFFF